MTKQIIIDNIGRQYEITITDQEDGGFDLDLVRHFWSCILHIGYAQCPLDSQGQLTLADIRIYDSPLLYRRLLVKCVPRFFWRKRVTEDYRRRGLGSAMLRVVINQATARGFKSIDGSVTVGDLIASPYLLGWYRKHGFKVTQPTGLNANKSPSAAWIHLELA
jgi:GNAT superfamily N-acetyltransferase